MHIDRIPKHSGDKPELLAMVSFEGDSLTWVLDSDEVWQHLIPSLEDRNSYVVYRYNSCCIVVEATCWFAPNYVWRMVVPVIDRNDISSTVIAVDKTAKEWAE